MKARIVRTKISCDKTHLLRLVLEFDLLPLDVERDLVRRPLRLSRDLDLVRPLRPPLLALLRGERLRVRLLSDLLPPPSSPDTSRLITGTLSEYIRFSVNALAEHSKGHNLQQLTIISPYPYTTVNLHLI
jgi:hypothetical protein